MKTVPLATFNQTDDARSFQGLLQQAGVPATIQDESNTERFWFLTKPVAAVHVAVAESEFLHARDLMAQWEHEANKVKGALHCPQCGSSRVQFPQVSRKSLAGRLQSVAMALHILPRQLYCKDCHHEWPPEQPKAP